MNFEEIKIKLEKLDTSSILDANLTLNGLINQINPLIKPIHEKPLKMIGKAVTVSCSNDFLPVVNALREASENDILVVDGKAGNLALAGEIFASEAKRKRLAGIVIDGAARDSAGIKTAEIPFYAKSINPRAGTAKKLAEINIPIYCGGIRVKPGDIVFGDLDGILVASREELAKVIDRALEIQLKEESVLERINSGSSLFDLLNFEEHKNSIKDSQPSTLKFVLPN